MSKVFKFAVDENATPSIEIVDFNAKQSLSQIYLIGGWSMTEIGVSGKFAGVNVALWCDEEGLLHNEVIVNRSATDFRNEVLGFMADPIVGVCVLTADDPETGVTPDFTDAQVAAITAKLLHGGYPVEVK
ncbi:Protein of unknown function DUF3846 [uncultured Caudovirales phage]|uniref:DUF3846 domain-containing protein n=1 Tax=uncultured Caudovirales phage TaxID=2100421 RepID=A0A6J5RY53_9CAUD|nr:Protein of unknown function DUF3846 [uncultured Caudovirales phage]